jgi:hypothetical protein
MKAKRLASTVVAAIALAVPAQVLAAPAQADPDTDFANELHIYGIYGQKDYNAWIGKIACKRLYNGVDKDAYGSARFVLEQLQKDSTTEQAYQFLGAALRTYCPEKLPVLGQLAGQPAPPPPVNQPPLAAE